MKLRSKLLLALLTLLAGACNASRATAPKAAYEDAPLPAASPAPTAYNSPTTAGPAAASPQARSAGAGDARESAARSDEAAAESARPGLGTSWGEDRNSRVQNTSFYRAEADHPFTTLGIYYNDASGVQAMAARGGRSDFVDNTFPAWNRALTVSLLDENRRPLPSTSSGGRLYVVGSSGQRYLIQIRNNTANRVEIVATVDGLDVIDGQPGSFQKRGYVMNAYGNLEIEGFRRSQDTVAAFRFGSVSDSYAERKGEGRNVGVVGVAFFAEQGSNWQWTDQEVQRRHDADPFPNRYAQPPQ